MVEQPQDRGRYKRHLEDDPENPNQPTDLSPDRRHLSIAIAFIGGLVVLVVFVLIAVAIL
jgi:hypothetical protein